MTNLLITGSPRSGKTTLIRNLLEQDFVRNKAEGFFTEELRERGERVGFLIKTIPEGKTALLARKDFPSYFRVGRYGVNTKALDTLCCESIIKALQKRKLVIIDEIGKMELFSDQFCSALLKALDSSQKVLATIMEQQNLFADKIKNRIDVKLLYLNKGNFKSVFEKSEEWIK